jgi:hypothetical protein
VIPYFPPTPLYTHKLKAGIAYLEALTLGYPAIFYLDSSKTQDFL